MFPFFQGNGIWFVFPWEPVGPSKGLGFMAYGEAMHTPITKFENNVAHSSDSVSVQLQKE